MKNDKRVLAFDIGGTKIASGIIKLSEKGYEIFDYQKIPTPKNKKAIINLIVEMALNQKKNGGFKKIRIGIAGQIDNKKGTVIFSPNIKDLKNVNFKKDIQVKISEDVEIENDVKCFALAERKFGKARKYDNVVFLTIGTGIGGAIQVAGNLYRGANNIAGEFGHMTIFSEGKKCECGKVGCWEQYASGRAIENLYDELFGKQKKAKDIALDSKKGLKKDMKVIKQTAEYFAVGLVNIINTVNPEAIIISGSVSKQKEIIDLAKKRALQKTLIPGRNTKIIISDLGDEAILIGAGL
ncbi:ROK family protein [Patescibacteria group bacterium]|nr:ROK family protein [Patescibacteria group bacterium]